MVLLFALCLQLVLGSPIYIGIVYSSKTPLSILSSLSQGDWQQVAAQVTQEISPDSPLQVVTANITDSEGKVTYPPSFTQNKVRVVIDVTNSLSRSQFLAHKAVEADFLHLVLDRAFNDPIGETVLSNSLYCETSPETEVQAFIDLIKDKNWTNLALIYDLEPDNMRQAEAFRSTYDKSTIKILDEIVLGSDDASEQFPLRLSAITKDAGARVFLVFTSPTKADQILKIADENAMGVLGFAWLLNSQALQYSNGTDMTGDYGVHNYGVVGFRPEDLNYLSSNSLGTLHSALTLVAQGYINATSSSQVAFTGSWLKHYLEGNPLTPTLRYPLHFERGVKQTVYEFINISRIPYHVGTWDVTSGLNYDSSANIIWPGIQTNAPDDTIRSFEFGFLSLNCTEYADCDSLLASRTLGINEAIQQFEANYTGYRLIPCYEDCLSKLKITSNLVAIISDVFPHKHYNNSVFVYADFSSNFTDDTLVVRTIQPVSFQAAAIGQILKNNDLKKVAVIYTDDDFGKSLYESFKNNLDIFGIQIDNDEHVIHFETKVNDQNLTVLTGDCKDSVDEVLSNVVRNQLKVIVYLGNDLVTAELAKVGYHKELSHDNDYVWIGGTWLTETSLKMIEQVYSSDKEDIYHVLKHAVGLQFPENSTDIEVELCHAQPCNLTEESLNAYLSVKLLGLTITGMIEEGSDYTNSSLLYDATSQVNFSFGVDSLLKYKIKPETKERSANGWRVAIFDGNSLVTCGDYNDGVLNMGNCSSYIDLAISDTWDTKFDCPFPEHNVTQNDKWTNKIMPVIVSLILLFFLVSVVAGWFKWRNIHFPLIAKNTKRKWRDTLVMLTCIVELSQMLSFCPTIKSLKGVFKMYSGLFMIDPVDLLHTPKQTYWGFLVGVMICVGLYFLVLLLMYTGFTHCNKARIWELNPRVVQLLYEYFLPFIGNTLYFPIVKLLLDALICDQEAQGRAFVRRDCYMECWTSEHLGYSATSGVFLGMFLLVSTYMRADWQAVMQDQQVYIVPNYLFIKTLVQVLLVLLSLGTRQSHEDVYSIAFLVLMVSFLGVTSWFGSEAGPGSYNYKPYTRWQLAFIALVTMISAISLIERNVEMGDSALVVVSIFSVGILLMFWGYIRRWESHTQTLLPQDKYEEEMNKSS
jgi:ABC-type branched-subunit amino acid transport system substrate-binding protein